MWNKLKLLFKIIKPAKDVAQDLGQIRHGWKTVEFWIVFLGHLGSLVAAIQGYVSPEVTLLINTGLAVVYNILRGAKKSKETGVISWWRTTEFWMSAGSQIGSGLLVLQQSGINSPYLTAAILVINTTLAISRDMAHKQPNDKK